MMPIEHSNYRHSVFHFFYRCGIIICWETHSRNGWIIYQSSTHYCWAILKSPYISGYSCHRGLKTHTITVGSTSLWLKQRIAAKKTALKICKSVGKLQKPPISGSIMKRCKVWDLNWHSHGIEACERSQLLGGWMKWTQLDMSCMLKVPKYHVSLLYLYVIAVLELVGQLRSDCGEQKRLILANLGLGRSDVCPRLPNAVRSSRSRCPHPVNLQSSAWAWWRLSYHVTPVQMRAYV